MSANGTDQQSDHGHSTSNNKDCADSPVWLIPREISMTNAYGIVARPVLITNVGSPINIMLTGGWKGRIVTATSSMRDKAVLWTSDLQHTSPNRGLFGQDTVKTHAWFLAMGTPWFLGRNILPKELLWFLTERCYKEASSAFADIPVVLKTVFEQFTSNCVPGIKPALLMDPRRFLEMRDPRKIICLCESAVRDNPGAHGMLVNCLCDRPGGLQCLAFIRLLESLFNDVIGSPEFIYLNFKCKFDGIFTTAVRAISGPSFSYSVSKVGDI